LAEYEKHVAYSISASDLIPAVKQRKKLFSEKMNLQSFSDIINSRDRTDEKIKALNMLAKMDNHTPDSIDIVVRATNDPSTEVKYIAATTLGKIEKPIISGIQRLTKQLRRKPEDLSTHAQLGYLCINYCNMGILDATHSQFYMDRAIKAYQSVLDIDPHRHEFILAIGKIHLSRKNYKKALLYFNRYIQEEPDDKNGYLFKAEVYFLQEDYHSLRNLFKDMDPVKSKEWKYFKNFQEMWA
ncbi:MAG: tetratricopeptide repeat protein, partial [bacterium]